MADKTPRHIGDKEILPSVWIEMKKEIHINPKPLKSPVLYALEVTIMASVCVFGHFCLYQNISTCLKHES